MRVLAYQLARLSGADAVAESYKKVKSRFYYIKRATDVAVEIQAEPPGLLVLVHGQWFRR